MFWYMNVTFNESFEEPICHARLISWVCQVGCSTWRHFLSTLSMKWNLGHLLPDYYRPQTKFAKVMFLQASVCPQGVCVAGRGVYGGGHAWRGGMHGGGACVAGVRACHACPSDTTRYGRSMRRRYASFWNAFLFLYCFFVTHPFLWIYYRGTLLVRNSTTYVRMCRSPWEVSLWQMQQLMPTEGTGTQKKRSHILS